jgi:hypothetical protein
MNKVILGITIVNSTLFTDTTPVFHKRSSRIFYKFENTAFSPETPISSCSNTGSIRDDPYWTSRKNSLELLKLSSVNKVSLV